LEPFKARAWKAGDLVRVQPGFVVAETTSEEEIPHGVEQVAIVAQPSSLAVLVEDVSIGQTNAQVETLEGESLSVAVALLREVPDDELERARKLLERAGVIRRRPGR
jgi:hypothetical protein